MTNTYQILEQHRRVNFKTGKKQLLILKMTLKTLTSKGEQQTNLEILIQEFLT